MMSINAAWVVIYILYLMNKDSSLINLYDYFDFFFMVFTRAVCVASKYALFSPIQMMFFRGSDFTADQLDAMLIGNSVDEMDPGLIELRVIEAINLVDLDEHLFKIKIKNDPNCSTFSKNSFGPLETH